MLSDGLDTGPVVLEAGLLLGVVADLFANALLPASTQPNNGRVADEVGRDGLLEPFELAGIDAQGQIGKEGVRAQGMREYRA